MKRNDEKQFAKVIGTIAVAFGKELNEFAIQVYFAALEDYSIQEIESAGTRLLKTWTHPGMLPTPAQFLEAITGDPSSRAHVAFETLMEAISHSGPSPDVQFQDPILMVAVEHYGGWPEVCAEWSNQRDQDVSYWEHNFKQVYQAAVRTGRKPNGKYLDGNYSRHNVANAGSFRRGLIPEPTVDVYGLDKKCVKVLLSKIEPQAALVGLVKKQLEARNPQKSEQLASFEEVAEELANEVKQLAGGE